MLQAAVVKCPSDSGSQGVITQSKQLKWQKSKSNGEKQRNGNKPLPVLFITLHYIGDWLWAGGSAVAHQTVGDWLWAGGSAVAHQTVGDWL